MSGQSKGTDNIQHKTQNKDKQQQQQQQQQQHNTTHNIGKMSKKTPSKQGNDPDNYEG